MLSSREKTIQHYIDQHNMSSFLNEHLLENLRLFHFPAYSNVYIEGDEQELFYLLVEGQVQCHHYHPDGKLAVIAVQDPFAAIGDVEVLEDTPLQSNVIATRKTTMLGIDVALMKRYATDDPRFLRFLVEQLRAKLYDTNHMQANRVLPVMKRLAVYVLTQVNENQSTSIILPDKESLASLLGTTSRHLNRVLKELIEQEIMSPTYPHIHVQDREALEELSL